MCGKKVNFIIFIASIIILDVVEGYVLRNPYDEQGFVGDEYLDYPLGGEWQNNAALAPIGGDVVRYYPIGRPYMYKRTPGFTPYISIGALSNMQQFFKNLRNNFNSLEKLSDDQARALLGSYKEAGECDPKKWDSTDASTQARARKHSYNKSLRVYRPPATAAYLHAVRNGKPSTRIRNFVSSSEPELLRGTNQYDPSYLWTGLGKRG